MSIETITEINLDVNQPVLEVVHAKQYDTVRKVKAHLFYNGVKWPVPTSSFVAVVAFKKSDRVGGFYDHTEDGIQAVEVGSDRSIITILLDRNTVTTVGNVRVEITFYDTSTSANARLSTFAFILQVESASLTELDLASNPYFNILSEDIKAVLRAEQNLTGLTASATKVAPGASDLNPTVTGGQGDGVPYNIDFKIPTFAGINSTPTVNTLPAGSSATASVSGGTSGTQKYSFTFGIPKGDKGDKPTPSSVAYAYANSTSATTVPSSGWSTTPNPVQGKYLWCRATTTWDSGGTSITYAVAYIAMDGTGSTAAEIITTDRQTVQAHLDSLHTEMTNKDLLIDIASFSALPKTVTDSRITADHVLSMSTLGTPSAQSDDWTVTTSAGSLTIAGTISGSTTLRLLLTKATSV